MSEDRRLVVPPDLASLLEASAEAGEYPTPHAALGDAIGRWARRHEDAAEDLAWLKASLNASMDDPRPSLSMDEVRAHMKGLIANAKTRPNEAA